MVALGALALGALALGCQADVPALDEISIAEPDAPSDASTEGLRARRVAALDPATQPLPQPCLAEKYQKAFLHGEKRGRHRVAMAWKKYNDCDQIEAFVDDFVIGIEDLVPEADTDKMRKYCRYSGQVEGTFLELEVVQEQCESKCFMDGDWVGQIQAKAYCDLAMDAEGEIEPSQWVRQPVGICGFQFEVGCDVSFLANTQSYTNGSGACAPYTRAPFFELWDSSRNKSCSYQRSPTR
jgi:hypothetical protein